MDCLTTIPRRFARAKICIVCIARWGHAVSLRALFAHRSFQGASQRKYGCLKLERATGT